MTGTGHVLIGVEQYPGRWVATCLCGRQVPGREKSLAVAGLFKHTIDANKPACPTPHKTQYPSASDADAAITRFLRRAGFGARPGRAYQCPSGQHWHTTKQPARKDA